MERSALKQLIAWKIDKDRKPLILQGARQVGKTWLMKEFAQKEYKNYVYISFDRNDYMKQLFSGEINVSNILKSIEIKTGIAIKEHETLIILDEIQECPEALTTLKYFCEEAPDYHIIVAGSLLGVSLSGSGFPVGKVDFMTLYPMTFKEFLNALGHVKIIEAIEKKDFEILKYIGEDIKNLLKQYYFVGGMPAVVKNFVANKDFKKVRKLQENILISYEQDFSKHTSSAIAERIRGLWLSIPSQLARENKKFIYGAVKSGAKAREYEQAINWLRDCGLIYKINCITKPYLPLRAYEDLKAFKLYILDVGLLTTLSNLDIKTILDGDKIFREFKGALAEQYALQQIKASFDTSINYWTSEGNAEVDFILQIENNVIPLEAKAEINLKAKSLSLYRKIYQPKYSIRTSLANFKVDNDLYNIPLYMISEIENILLAQNKPSQLSLFDND